MSREDVIVISSVSCIYGLGSPDEYQKEQFLSQREKISIGGNIE